MSNICKIENYVDDNGRSISLHTPYKNHEDVTYMGQGFVPVPAVRQVIPFSFKIYADDIGDAYDKFDDVFKDAQTKALQDIQNQMTQQSTGIVTPGESVQMKSLRTPAVDMGK